MSLTSDLNLWKFLSSYSSHTKRVVWWKMFKGCQAETRSGLLQYCFCSLNFLRRRHCLCLENTEVLLPPNITIDGTTFNWLTLPPKVKKEEEVFTHKYVCETREHSFTSLWRTVDKSVVHNEYQIANSQQMYIPFKFIVTCDRLQSISLLLFKLHINERRWRYFSKCLSLCLCDARSYIICVIDHTPD